MLLQHLNITAMGYNILYTANFWSAHYECYNDYYGPAPNGYLGAVITSTGDCSVEIRSRLGIARSALTSMNNLWKDRALNKETKVRLMRALVWPVATYGCESWTLKASDKKRIAGFEMTAYRRMLRITLKDHRQVNIWKT